MTIEVDEHYELDTGPRLRLRRAVDLPRVGQRGHRPFWPSCGTHRERRKTMSAETTNALPKRGQVFVLLTRQRRVRHLAVWGDYGDPGPLCRNRGEFPIWGDFTQYDGIPCCERCAQEAQLLASAANIAGWSGA